MQGSRHASAPSQNIRLVTSTTNVTTSAYVELTSSVATEVIDAYISNPTSQDIIIAIGPSGGEVDTLYVPTLEHRLYSFHVSKGTRLSVKAFGSTITSGAIIVVLFM